MIDNENNNGDENLENQENDDDEHLISRRRKKIEPSKRKNKKSDQQKQKEKKKEAEHRKKVAESKKKTIERMSTPDDEKFGKDFANIINQPAAMVPADISSLTNKKQEYYKFEDIDALSMQKAQDHLLENARPLMPLEMLVAEQLADGKSAARINQDYKIPLDEIEKMYDNPLFRHTINQLTASTGVADKNVRLRNLKGLMEPLSRKLLEKFEDETELNSLGIERLQRLYMEQHNLMSKLLGEDKEIKTSNVNITVKLQKHIQERKGDKTIDLEKYNPNDEYGVYEYGQDLDDE